MNMSSQSMDSNPLCRRFQVQRLTKYYPRGRRKIPVFTDFSFDLYDGLITGLVGPSGAGKSTLCRIMMRLEGFQEGRILYRETPLDQVPLKRLREENQIVFQNPYFAVNPYVQIKRIISEPMVIRRMKPREIRERVKEVTAMLEIPEGLLDRFPGEVSGGQLQRVAMARTITLRPGYIFLDEPFSAVDQIMALRLMRHFKKIFEALNIGALFISHDPRQIRFFSHRALKMEPAR